MYVLILQTSKAHAAIDHLDYTTSIGKWKRRDIQCCRFDSYDLIYAHYSKFPSWGLQAMPLKRANIFPFPPPLLQQQPDPLLSPFNCKNTQNQQNNNNSTPLTTDNTVAVLMPQPLQSFQAIHFSADKIEKEYQQIAIKNNCPSSIKHDIAIKKWNVPAMFYKMDSHNKNPNALLIHLIFIILCLQMIPYILIYYIEECSPLVLFSWWRNKISWKLPFIVVC